MLFRSIGGSGLGGFGRGKVSFLKLKLRLKPGNVRPLDTAVSPDTYWDYPTTYLQYVLHNKDYYNIIYNDRLSLHNSKQSSWKIIYAHFYLNKLWQSNMHKQKHLFNFQTLACETFSSFVWASFVFLASFSASALICLCSSCIALFSLSSFVANSISFFSVSSTSVFFSTTLKEKKMGQFNCIILAEMLLPYYSSRFLEEKPDFCHRWKGLEAGRMDYEIKCLGERDSLDEMECFWLTEWVNLVLFRKKTANFLPWMIFYPLKMDSN